MTANSSKRRMKYLHVVSIFPALTETFVLREARALRQTGCDVVIGQLRPVGNRPTCQGFEDLQSCAVRARLLSLSTLFGILFFTFTKPKLAWSYTTMVLTSFPDTTNMLKLAYILLSSIALAYRLRRSGLQHVRGHHLHSEAVGAMFIAGFLGLPYSFKVYTVKTYYPRRVLIDVVQRAAFIIADTLQVRDFLSSLRADPQNVHILRNAVPLAEFPMREHEPASELPIILAVGRLDYKKGFHVLISACSILREEGMHVRCVIVGDGDVRSSLLARRRTLNLEEHVEMAGSLEFSDVQRWYERATLLAVPSVVAPDGSTDGLPTVIIEAFARGVPVVGSATAGIPEIIHSGINGFVVAAGSPRELANRLKELLLDQDMRRKFASEARRTVERDFDLDRNAQVLADLMLGHVGQHAKVSSSAVVPQPAVEHTSSRRFSVHRS